MGHQDRKAQRQEARHALGKIDRLYDFVRGLGLHYKLIENFGCSVITVGRNSHPFSGIYEESSNPSASKENKADISDNVFEELEDAFKEIAELELTQDGLRSKINELENLVEIGLRESGSLKQEKMELADELEKVKLEANKTLKANTEIIANNISLKYQLDIVEQDAKEVNLKSRDILKENERIKKIRTETEASKVELSKKIDQLAADLEASKEAEDYLSSTVIRSEKLTASLREQQNSLKAKASDFEQKANEAVNQISELTWYKDNWELLKADKVKIKELLNTWMDEADEESEKKAKEEKEQESELTWYKDNWELWKSEEDKAKKQLITRLEEAEEEIKNLETKTTRSQATSAIAGSGDDSGLEISTVTEATTCNCSQSLEHFLEELAPYQSLCTLVRMRL